MYRYFVTFRFWIYLIGVLFFIHSGIAEEDFRTWTSSDGKKLEAKYLRKIGDKIKIVTRSEIEFTVLLSRFSVEDQQYVASVLLQESFKAPEPFSYQKKGAVIIAQIDGKVEVGNYYDMHTAKVGQIVSTSQFIRTGSNSSAIVIFTNGTTASIAPKTHLIFQNIWQKQTISSPLKVSEIREESSSCRIFLELKSGGLVVDAKKLKKDSSFVVNSPIVACGIRGTKFRFSATEERYNLSVLEGEVSLLDSRKKILSVRDKQILTGIKTVSSPIQKMNDSEAGYLIKTISKIKEVSSEYSLSQLQQVLVRQNKVTEEKIKDAENKFPLGTSWFSRYRVWLKNPEPFGGRNVLVTMKNSKAAKSLFLAAKKIKDISPFYDFTNLTNLGLSSNQITDLTPLSKLTNLTSLYLSSNQITDLTPLSRLTNLTSLYLSSNQITDLTPLSRLTNLTSLELNYNQITDLTPLSELTNLTSLYLGSNQIIDLTPLSELTNLSTLHLSSNKIIDPSSLSKLTNLTKLYLADNQIQDREKHIKELRSALPRTYINW